MAKKNNVKVRGYVSTVMGCPYQGEITPAMVYDVSKKLLNTFLLKNNFKIKPSKNFARLPTKPDEASSNWKSLSTLIKPVQSKGRLLYLERKKKKEAAKKIEESAFVISDKTNAQISWQNQLRNSSLG